MTMNKSERSLAEAVSKASRVCVSQPLESGLRGRGGGVCQEARLSRRGHNNERDRHLGYSRSGMHQERGASDIITKKFLPISGIAFE